MMEATKSTCSRRNCSNDASYDGNAEEHARDDSFESGKSLADEMPNKKPVMDQFLPLDIKGEFLEFYKIIAEEKLGETTEKRKQALQALKKMIQDACYNFKTDDLFLLPFLRARKFDVTRAFGLMENFYRLKSRYNPSPLIEQRMQAELDEGLVTSLPYRDPDGRLILLFRFRILDPDLCSLSERLNAAFPAVQKMFQRSADQIAGLVAIVDVSGVSLKWLKHIGIGNARLLKFFYIDALPIRYKAIHLVNQNPLTTQLYYLMKMIVSKKLIERYHVHGSNMESLHKHIPSCLLPREFGGTEDIQEVHYNIEDAKKNLFI